VIPHPEVCGLKNPSRVLQHLGDRGRTELLNTVNVAYANYQAGKSEPIENEETFGIGPGLLRHHAVTDEWVLEHPLWTGLGHGLFADQHAPQNAKELRGLYLCLLTDMIIGNPKKAPNVETFAARAITVRDKLASPQGASYADVMDVLLARKPGAELLLMTHLFCLADDSSKNDGVFITTSSIAYRFLEPLVHMWKERRAFSEKEFNSSNFTWDWRPFRVRGTEAQVDADEFSKMNEEF